MESLRCFNPQLVYCRKDGKRIAECIPGKQAWYQNGEATRMQVFAIEIDDKPMWVDREALMFLRRRIRLSGLVFTTRRGLQRAPNSEGVRGFKLLNGRRTRVIFTEGRWVTERAIMLRWQEAPSFVLPVPDQTAE